MDDEIHRSLGRLEAKVDALLEAHKIHAAQHADTERRLAVIEKDLFATKRVGGLIAFVITIGSAILPSYFGK